MELLKRAATLLLVGVLLCVPVAAAADDTEEGNRYMDDLTPGDFAGDTIETVRDDLKSEAPLARGDQTGEAVLDLSLGNLVIGETGYRLNGQPEVPHIGPYRLTGGGGTVHILSGDHTLTLWNVAIDVRDRDGEAALAMAEGTSVRLNLEGESRLMSGKDCAGIQVGEGKGGASMTIGGSGILVARGGANAAGIGGGYQQKNGTVTIEGGVIEAHGGQHGAGIGGGRNTDSYKTYNGSGGVITIAGGTVTAVGGDNGAGIGGGNHGDGGVITVTGGTILLAQGGGGGAGIGSGLGSSRSVDKGPGHYTGGAITLEGDFVIHEALGGSNAAGIGGGMYGDSGAIRIRGGEIGRAVAGGGTVGSLHHGAAGIGGGYQGHCDIVIVGEATIGEAVGSFSGAGIGSGGTANAGVRLGEDVLAGSNVFICSSYIYRAQGGQYGGAGIGGGASADDVTVTLCGHIIRAYGDGGGSGIGSGLYDATRSYASPTELRLFIDCGDIGADSVGGGEGNDPGEVTVNVDDLDELDVPGLDLPESEGYIGVYNGRAYGIFVDLPGAELTYSEAVDGDYTPENPMYSEVGTYQVFYRAQVDYIVHRGSEQVIITPLGDSDGGGSKRPPTGSGVDTPDPEPFAPGTPASETPPDVGTAPVEPEAPTGGEPIDGVPGKEPPATGVPSLPFDATFTFSAAALAAVFIRRLKYRC